MLPRPRFAQLIMELEVLKDQMRSIGARIAAPAVSLMATVSTHEGKQHGTIDGWRMDGWQGGRMR